MLKMTVKPINDMEINYITPRPGGVKADPGLDAIAPLPGYREPILP